MTAYRWGTVVVMVAAVGAAGCAAKKGDGTAGEAVAEVAPAAATLNPADVAVAERLTLRSGFPLSGALEPKVRVTVGAPLAEQLVEMYVNEGDRVRQGQPLAKFKDQVLQAAATYANTDVTTQRMNVRVAEAESARAVALFAEGAIAQRDRDNAMAALEGAHSRLSLAVSQAANAEDRLRSATLTAPVSGVVSKRFAQAGDRVDNGKPVVELVDTRVLQLSASVPTEWLSELRVGRPVSLTVAQLDSAQVTGRISRINPTADRGDPADPDLRGRAEPARDPGRRPVRVGPGRDAGGAQRGHGAAVGRALRGRRSDAVRLRRLQRKDREAARDGRDHPTTTGGGWRSPRAWPPETRWWSARSRASPTARRSSSGVPPGRPPRVRGRRRGGCSSRTCRSSGPSSPP